MIVIIPNDNVDAKLKTLGMHDIGVVPRLDLTDRLTPKLIMNKPMIRMA